MKWLPPELREPFVLRSLLILLLVEFARGALIITLLPNIGIDGLNLTPATIGLAISVHYGCDNFLRTPMGMLTDRFGQRAALIAGITTACIGLILIAGAPSALVLVLGSAVFGLGLSPLWPAVVSAVTSSCPAEQRASAMGFVFVSWIVGASAGPILINFVFTHSYSAAFTILIAVLLVGGLIAVLSRSEAGTRPVPRSTAIRRDVCSYLREIVVHLREVRVLFPGMFVQTFAIGVLIPVLMPYARVVLGVSPQMQSIAIIVVGGLTVTLLPLAGRLVDRFGARPFLSGGFLLSASALALFAAQRSLWAATLLMLIVGASYAMILPSWNTVLDRSVDSAKRAAMWGMFMTIEGLGTATGPLVGGQLWDSVGPHAPFLLSASVIGTMGLLYIFIRIPGLHGQVKTSTGLP